MLGKQVHNFSPNVLKFCAQSCCPRWNLMTVLFHWLFFLDDFFLSSINSFTAVKVWLIWVLLPHLSLLYDGCTWACRILIDWDHLVIIISMMCQTMLALSWECSNESIKCHGAIIFSTELCIHDVFLNRGHWIYVIYRIYAFSLPFQNGSIIVTVALLYMAEALFFLFPM